MKEPSLGPRGWSIPQSFRFSPPRASTLCFGYLGLCVSGPLIPGRVGVLVPVLPFRLFCRGFGCWLGFGDLSVVFLGSLRLALVIGMPASQVHGVLLYPS